MIVHHEFLNNEIHVRIAGDQGGRVLKWVFKLWTLLTQKARTISPFSAPHYRISILVGLQRFTKQVKDRQEMSWR